MRPYAVNRYDRAIAAALELTRLRRSLATFAALTLALLLWVEDADARLDGALSFGSFERGGRAALTPPVDANAHLEMAAVDQPGAGQLAHPGGTLGGLFNRPGLVAGFAAGFLGAGPLGLLFGQGLFGGLNGVASYLGLMFQLALVVMLGRLIWIWWSGRNAAAFAGLSPRQQAEAYLRSRNELLPGIYPRSSQADALADGDQTPASVAAGNTATPAEPTAK
jgi:hypothetical protein